MKVVQAKREFKFKERILSDPNPAMTPEQVVEFYTNQFPEFTTATIDNGKPDLEKETITYTIGETLGTKG